MISILSVSDTTEDLNHVIKLHQVEQLRRQLIISIQNVQGNLYTVHTPLSQDLNLIVENVITLEENSKKCSTCHHEPHINSRIITVQSLVKDYGDLLSFYITGTAMTERMEEHKILAAKKGSEILSEVTRMSHSATQKLEELTKAVTENIQKIRNILFITIVVTFLAGIMMAFKLTRTVTHPVLKLLEATKEIAAGKLGTTVSYTDTKEFGELAENFNIMSGELKKRTDALVRKESEVQKKSGELKNRVKELEDFYEMAIGRELKMKELKKNIEHLQSKIGRLEAELARHKK